MAKKTPPSLVQEHLRILRALLNEAKVLKSIPKKQADIILEHAWNARKELSSDWLKEVGGAFLKTEGIDSLPSDPQRS